MEDQGLGLFHRGLANQFGRVAEALQLQKPKDSFVIPVENTA